MDWEIGDSRPGGDVFVRGAFDVAENQRMETWIQGPADPPSPADEYMLLEADPGDVIFFDAYVPHGSPANRPGTGRIMEMRIERKQR